MNKKFTELKAGDSVWIWWLSELYEYGVQDIGQTKQYMLTDEGEKELEPNGDRHLLLKGGAGYYLTKECADSEAFVYGCDGHEYKILGTSKDAVRKCLEDNLNADMKKLEDNTKKWLLEFDISEKNLALTIEDIREIHRLLDEVGYDKEQKCDYEYRPYRKDMYENVLRMFIENKQNEKRRI